MNTSPFRGRKDAAMIRPLFSRTQAASRRRSTFVPSSGPTTAPAALPFLAIAAAIAVSAGVAGLVLPLFL